MTNREALEVLRKESGCLHTAGVCFAINCTECKYNTVSMDVTKAIDTAIEALEFCAMIEDDGR